MKLFTFCKIKCIIRWIAQLNYNNGNYTSRNYSVISYKGKITPAKCAVHTYSIILAYVLLNQLDLPEVLKKTFSKGHMQISVM